MTWLKISHKKLEAYKTMAMNSDFIDHNVEPLFLIHPKYTLENRMALDILLFTVNELYTATKTLKYKKIVIDRHH